MPLPIKPPEPPKPYVPTAKDFLTWVQGRTGLTWREFFDAWVGAYNLTPEQREALWNQVKDKDPEKRKPPWEKPPEKKPPAKPPVKPELVIPRTPYPKWWKDSLNATISFAAPGSQILATAQGALKLFVSTIVLTVTGETQITITFGNAGSSGPIFLGGTDQPMGIVIAMGNSPAPCGAGPLTITATDPGAANPSIGGFATCFAVQEKIL